MPPSGVGRHRVQTASYPCVAGPSRDWVKVKTGSRGRWTTGAYGICAHEQCPDRYPLHGRISCSFNAAAIIRLMLKHPRGAFACMLVNHAHVPIKPDFPRDAKRILANAP